jgi:hypothetical protein
MPIRRIFQWFAEMDAQVLAALLAGVVALIVALATGAFSVLNSQQIEKLKTKAEAEKKTSYYSHPLARSAYELKNRLSNILDYDFLGIYYATGTPRYKLYAIDNTVFVTAQFLCWSEIVRRDIQYLDMQEIIATRNIGLTRAAIAQIWRDDRKELGTHFRLFSGEQQQAGEALIRRAIIPGVWECMGYGEFLDSFSQGTDKIIDHIKQDPASRGTDIIDQIKRDLVEMNGGPADAKERMSRLHCKLKDLIAQLDPAAVIEPEYRNPKNVKDNSNAPQISSENRDEDKSKSTSECPDTAQTRHIGPWPPWD